MVDLKLIRRNIINKQSKVNLIDQQGIHRARHKFDFQEKSILINIYQSITLFSTIFITL